MHPIIRVAAAASLIACTADRPDDTPRELPLLRLEARDFTFTGPASVPSGLTRIRLVNHGAEWHEAVITRLSDSTTTDTYLAAARAGQSFPAGAHDVGGPGQVATGDSSDVVISLEPGRYAIVCWAASHVKAGMIAPLVITVNEASSGRTAAGDADTTGAPAATGEVLLEDFRIVHDSGIYRPGANVLRVLNTGERPHDLTFYRLEPGKTVRDFGEWFRTRQGTPPAMPVGGMVTLAPGRDGWVELDLPPGSYFAACGTPENGPNGVQIHAQMGMIEVFETR